MPPGKTSRPVALARPRAAPRPRRQTPTRLTPSSPRHRRRQTGAGACARPPFLSLLDDRDRLLRFRWLDDVEAGGLADPVLDLAPRRRAGQPYRLEQRRMQLAGLLRAQVWHRVDAEPSHQWDPALHP